MALRWHGLQVRASWAAQMLGKAAFNFYPDGDKLVIMANDSKSFSSVSIDPLVKLYSNFSEDLNNKRGAAGNFNNLKLILIKLIFGG